MNELDFDLEMNAEGIPEAADAALYAEADSRLRQLAKGRQDITGAAVTVRPAGQPSGLGEKVFLFEVTVVAYVRPETVAATKKADNPTTALKEALDAIERQVRQRREKLDKPWEQPGKDPVTQEIIAVAASEEPVEEEGE